MKDWPSVALGDIFEIARGGSPRPIQNFLTEEPDGVNWVMIGDASDSSKYITHTKKRILKTGVKNSRMVYPGDFLLTNSMSFGHPYIMKTSGCIHDGWLVLSNKKGVIDQDYFYHLLGSDLIYAEFSRLASGSTVKNLNIEIVKGIKVSLPPLEEQRRIAAILDKADGVRRKRKEAIRLTEELLKSTFLEMFGDPVTNPKGWEIKTIEDITVNQKGAIKRGPFGGALKKDIFTQVGFLVYEQYHALNNDFSFERYYIDEDKFEEMKGFEVKPGDIIISCSGVYLGKLAIVPENAKPGIINQALLRITLNQRKMNNYFFVYHFSHESFRAKFFAANRGSGVPNFPPISEFKTFPFIVPPIEEQNKFSARLQQIQGFRSKAYEGIKESENLFNSLLQKAFRGEL
ncbi:MULTISPECIES: restriction endonuclease subunit S [unclassified Microcystis]|jgi:type I restriction enzyme S subunit|uniref:restriction endonuclease subunit S n=1 Tax=unclassified Microcystis TaxID=2643300 RepID=UPI0022BEB863|nr:restriction endonuclease subunit S [Microcystis sp. LE19-195.1E]MCZ8248757.1 restriction endonuclease subunit S [Microcystis sp. LE19-195.1E]